MAGYFCLLVSCFSHRARSSHFPHISRDVRDHRIHRRDPGGRRAMEALDGDDEHGVFPRPARVPFRAVVATRLRQQTGRRGPTGEPGRDFRGPSPRRNVRRRNTISPHPSFAPVPDSRPSLPYTAGLESACVRPGSYLTLTPNCHERGMQQGLMIVWARG